MLKVLKPLLAVLVFVSFADANPDPLDILRGNIPKRVVKKPKKRKVVRRRVKRVTKKRRVKKKVASRRSNSGFKTRREYRGYTRNSPYLSKPINYQIYSKHTPTGKAYLDMKAIDGPMPSDYSALYLKSKSLQNVAKPQLKIIVDKSSQRMYVYRDFEHLYTFKVSTGKKGYITPNGVFKPYSVERMHFSKKYFNAPMPWSVFFNNGIAIHATSSIGRLGTPASHGCVRTYPKSAKRVYHLVRRYGKSNTTVIVRY